MSAVKGPLQSSCGEPGSDLSAQTTAQKVRALLDALSAIDATSRGNGTASAKGNAKRTLPAAANARAAESEFPIHVPVWVEAPLSSSRTDSLNLRGKSILAIAPASQQVVELVERLERYSERYLVAVVGPSVNTVVSGMGHSNVICADLSDENVTATALAQIDEFQADVVFAVDSIASWDLSEVLTKVATDNSLCELLFLVAKHHVDELKTGCAGTVGAVSERIPWRGTSRVWRGCRTAEINPTGDRRRADGCHLHTRPFAG